ncbi:hypothetical protein [Oryzifoliimicrobium ureilyticus]|uniref:hypothetical protein n=1 Tax=Oryzifoliimicrobium ureilyticus TaxID=3113724 RepID=UPI00307638F0
MKRLLLVIGLEDYFDDDTKRAAARLNIELDGPHSMQSTVEHSPHLRAQDGVIIDLRYQAHEIFEFVQDLVFFGIPFVIASHEKQESIDYPGYSFTSDLDDLRALLEGLNRRTDFTIH